MVDLLIINYRKMIPLLAMFLIANIAVAFGQGSNHSCGPANIHNPSIQYGRVTDIDGNQYKAVIIGNQAWFAENLKVTRFQNGDPIPQVSDSAAWAGVTGPAMCSYRNDNQFDCPRGKLYNFFVAADVRNPCPAGWRVPSMTDLYNLIFHLDPNANPQQPGNTPNTAGSGLKSTGLTYWRTPNATATNLTGFSAIPNGGRNNVGAFSLSSDAAASYWLSTPAGANMSLGFFLELAFSQGYAVRNAYFSRYGACIRCVADKSVLNVNTCSELVIYPSPNTGAFTIRLPTGFSTGTNAISIYDSKGAQVYAQTRSFVNLEASFDLKKLASGVYFISVWDSSGKEQKTGKVKVIR
ncbi:MAG: FISUMP domain-containing protein [Bacteroidota bacterium]|jgi:uncharacterized protein (TIGR02145 family)